MADNDEQVYWYYAVDGEQKGPVDQDTLRQLIADGTVRAKDLVWNDSMGDQWVEVRTLPALFESTAPAPDSAAAEPGLTPAGDTALEPVLAGDQEEEPPPPPPEEGETDDWFHAPRPATELISATAPVSPAWDRMKRMLFMPFDLGKWFLLGFSAWLATLGKGQGGGISNLANLGDVGSSMSDRGNPFDEPIFIAIAVLVVVLIIVLSLVFAWLRSRGTFMFLHNVVRHTQEIGVPWREYKAEGNSLFGWIVVLGLVGLLTAAIPIALLVFTVIMPSVRAEDFLMSTIPMLVISILLLLAIGLVFGYIRFFLDSIVVPIMYLRRCTASEAWRVFTSSMWQPCKGKLLVYGLFYWLLMMLTSVLTGTAALVTCGLCCTMYLPYVGTVVMLPIWVFFQCYALEYLSQYGPEFDVWALETAGETA